MRGLPELKRAASAALSGLGLVPKENKGTQLASEESLPSLMKLVYLLPPTLLMQALTHSSWVGSRLDSYERLEFLGDSVLGLAIAEALYLRYPEKEEGELARLKAFVVSRASCAQVAERLGVAGLIMEKSPASLPKRSEAAASTTVQGNVLEALIGASFIAHGFAQTAPAVVEAFSEQFQLALTESVDPKTALQELVAARGLRPSYELVSEDGPPHARWFTSQVIIAGKTWGTGSGSTIKMSEQQAAGEALAALQKQEER